MLAEKEELYTVDEFYAMPQTSEQNELINGRIYYMSPPPNIRHQSLSMGISAEIRNYIRKNKGKCRVFAAPTGVKLDERTNVMPDIFVVCDPDKLDEQKCSGAPDFVIEILSPSNSNHDTVDKLELYVKAGVKEYWIVDPMSERVIVYTNGSLHITGFYSFDDDIPVGIFADRPEPLTIKINDA